jgi:hypothetical protein
MPCPSHATMWTPPKGSPTPHDAPRHTFQLQSIIHFPTSSRRSCLQKHRPPCWMLQPDCTADWQGLRLSIAMEIGTSWSQGLLFLWSLPHPFYFTTLWPTLTPSSCMLAAEHNGGKKLLVPRGRPSRLLSVKFQYSDSLCCFTIAIRKFNIQKRKLICTSFNIAQTQMMCKSFV